MTDHGNIYGAVHFFDAAKKRASSRSWAVNSIFARRKTIGRPSGDKYNHLLVLAENEEVIAT